ncbi:transcriptional regulator [Bordetella pertussis]|nr:transcriptional regulator [Bordetella pertussis]
MLASLEVRELAKAGMSELAVQTGGAVALGAFDNDAMVYVEAMHGSPALYLRLPVGYRASLDTAMGRPTWPRCPRPRARPCLGAWARPRRRPPWWRGRSRS